jgi:hypothetical protein
MSCRAWPSSQSWAFFSAALVALGRSSRNTNGMMISKNSMRTKRTTRTTWFAVEDLLVDQNMQPGQVAGARDAAQRADQDGEPKPGLSQHPLRPAVLLLLHRLPLPGRLRRLAPAVQAAGCDQRADGEQEQAKG